MENRSRRPSWETFQLGACRVEPSRNRIFIAEIEVKVRGKSMDVLVHLARRSGRVVSRPELIDAIWQGRAVTDDVLKASIYELRKAMGDDSKRPKFIETTPGRGYSCIVQPVPVADEDQVQGRPNREDSSAEYPNSLRHTQEKSRIDGWLGRTLVALSGALICVGGIAALRVAEPGAGAAAAVNRCRAALPLSRHVSAHPTAVKAYLAGLRILQHHRVQDFEIASNAFRRAIALEPVLTEAHLGLAETLHRMRVVGRLPEASAQLGKEAREAVRQALALDPSLSYAYVVLARLQMDDWQLTEAEDNLRRAIRQQPDSVAARRAYAWLLSAQGRKVAAEVHAFRAMDLDRICPDRYLELADILYFARKPEDSLRVLEQAIDLAPSPPQAGAWFGMFRAHELLGHEQLAFDYLRRAFHAWGDSEQELATLGRSFRREGLIGIYRSCARERSEPIGGRAECFARIGATDDALTLLEHMVESRNPNSILLKVHPAYQSLHGHPRFRALLDRVGLQVPSDAG